MEASWSAVEVFLPPLELFLGSFFVSYLCSPLLRRPWLRSAALSWLVFSTPANLLPFARSFVDIGALLLLPSRRPATLLRLSKSICSSFRFDEQYLLPIVALGSS